MVKPFQIFLFHFRNRIQLLQVDDWTSVPRLQHPVLLLDFTDEVHGRHHGLDVHCPNFRPCRWTARLQHLQVRSHLCHQFLQYFILQKQ